MHTAKEVGVIILISVLCVLGDANFDLLQNDSEKLLFISTIDGTFICLDRDSGSVRWKIKEEPVVRVPDRMDTTPLFLPDPKDGSLYIWGSPEREALQKMQFTIPQLVASSPCRSSDGILYTGKKLDTWFSVNPVTGAKKPFLNSQGMDSTCPRESAENIYIGRTEYNIIMIDTLRNRKMWNVTFYDYASYEMDHESLQLYDAVHFTGSSSGRLLTLNTNTGALKWQAEFGSPVIAMYLLKNGGLITVPFTNIAESTLDSLIDEVTQRSNSNLGLEFKPNDLKLLPTLYVGEHVYGLYALPSLVDHNTATIELARKGPLLLEGPSDSGPSNSGQQPFDGEHEPKENPAVVILGHYKVPDFSATRLQIAAGDNASEEIGRSSVAVQTDGDYNTDWAEVWAAILDVAHGNMSARAWYQLGKTCWWFIYSTVANKENLMLKAVTVFTAVVTLVLWNMYRQIKDIQQQSQTSRKSESGSGWKSGIVRIPDEPAEGVVVIGKIRLFTDQVLGKGCEGTFVYRGEFDSRPVAVKRVLPECFTFADREVDLLRESDAHANVVRYFCTEEDKQFRYIALELCAATVHDYVQGSYSTDKITPMQILMQATQGLSHLHSLHIVHRDIKPHNVLLSMESQQGEVRAMISDFGLCKKLQTGRASFSRRSGVTGTDGWIAQEMIHGDTRATCSVDIFSMGCVYYYVLTRGKHPFGDTLHRQANILNGESDLTGLMRSDQLALKLIEQMIAIHPTDRPPVTAVLKHPIFWNQARILNFFQDVSDRVEKEGEDSHVLQRLEECSGVLRGDWRSNIDSVVAEDLRKYRNYRGDSVRDLLRALRNKKHHYRELSTQAQKNLGEIPIGFVAYWTSRFPLLLLHSWLAFQYVKREPIFKQYYDMLYNFPRLPVVELEVASMESEGFNLKRNSLGNNRRSKQLEVPSENNWRLGERRLSDPTKANFEINLQNDELFSNAWFQQWYHSDFRDDNAFIQWKGQEYYNRPPFQQEGLQPEFPTWDQCERLRRQKRFLEEEKKQLIVPALNQNKASPRRFRRRPNSKKPDEPVEWKLPPT